jgi:hypothetical protein
MSAWLARLAPPFPWTTTRRLLSGVWPGHCFSHHAAALNFHYNATRMFNNRHNERTRQQQSNLRLLWLGDSAARPQLRHSALCWTSSQLPKIPPSHSRPPKKSRGRCSSLLASLKQDGSEYYHCDIVCAGYIVNVIGRWHITFNQIARMIATSSESCPCRTTTKN